MTRVGVACRAGLGSGPGKICCSNPGSSFCLLLLEQTSVAVSVLTQPLGRLERGGGKPQRSWGEGTHPLW